MSRPETSLEFIVGWFEKARDAAKKQGKADSAALWADGLSHLKWQAAELDRLQARVAELEVDAERYRWLRDWCPWSASGGPTIMQPCYDNGTFTHNELLVGDAADAAIDTARKAKP